MNKIGWAFLIVLGAIIAIGVSGGFERAPEPTNCSGKREAVEAADAANRKLLGNPGDYERTGAIFTREGGSTHVGLLYRANGRGGRAQGITVADDCSIVGIG